VLYLCEELKKTLLYWKLDKGKSTKKNHFMKSYTTVRVLQSCTLSCVVFLGFKNQFARSMYRNFICGEVYFCGLLLYDTMCPGLLVLKFGRKILLPSSLYEVTTPKLQSFMTHRTTVWIYFYYLYNNRFLSHMGSQLGVVEFMECRHVVRSRGFASLSISNWFNRVAALR